jgi:Galactose oxidase, central domain
MTTSRFLFLSVLHLLLAAPVCRAGELSVNKWTRLSDGKIEMPKKGYPNLAGPKMVWAEHIKAGVIAPCFYYQRTRVDKFSFDAPEWKMLPGSAPTGTKPDIWNSPGASCYLPGLKKVLMLKRQWWHSRNKKLQVYGWLLDPADGKWEPLTTPAPMTDKSVDFEPAKGRDGADMPIWGSLCYDGHNREAVAFGGGGVWGRVDKVRSKVAPGDWTFDEKLKRTRRLTAEDKGKVTEARRWFPGHCGTWTFSESAKKWKSIKQPLHAQPSGRILPGMAYDAGEQKIVLFGGDDLAKCYDDTWVYDCKTRTWKEVKPAVRPRARAGQAMVYLPEAKAILMAGGYAGGWGGLGDVWLYRTAKNEWTCLGDYRVQGSGRKAKSTPTGLALPVRAAHCSGAWVPEKKAVVLACYPGARGNRAVPVFAMKFQAASIAKVPPTKVDPQLDYHCKAWTRWGSLLPEEWAAGKNKPGDRAAGKAELTRLPANTWVNRKPPVNVPSRGWGSYVYDIRSHKGFAWGGGHSTYPGAEISEYDVITNRWRSMAQSTNYNPFWLHGMVGGPPGISFGGWSLLPSHARKSYGVDPLSNSVVTYGGDVYSIKHHSVIAHIGGFPVNWGGPSYQVAYVTAKHGLYAYSHRRSSKAVGCLAKANVAAGKWEVVARGGPLNHNEHDFLVYDSKRDRLLYFKRAGAVLHTFDFKTRKWTEEKPAAGKPSTVLGDGTYIPEMDAVLLVFGKGKETMYFYKCAEKKWYTAPYVGDAAWRGNGSGKDWSPIYDPGLKLVVRFYPAGHKWMGINVMRLEPKSLKLTPIE